MATNDDSLLDSPRFSGFQRSIPWRASKAHIGPFRATQIWNEIIDHLKSRVELKRRRMKMKTYENCFTGQDAVDVVLTYLLSERNTFSSDLSREKAIKLCQSLMDRQVFSPVSSRNSEVKKSFDDSQHKLYRFVGSDTESETSSTIAESSDEDQECSIMEDARRKDLSLRINPDMEPDLIADVLCNPIAVNKQGQVLQEIVNLQMSLKSRSRSSLKADNSLIERSRLKVKTDFSPDALEDLWKEVALCQLLTIVDLPFLDGLLNEEKSTKKQVRQNLIISNVVSKHWNIPLTGVKDPFMKTALNCIECLPNGISVLEKDFVREATPGSKIQSCYVLSEHYTNVDEPLLPESFIDLHLAILNLVLQQKEQIAIEALRLDMILLPWHTREELHRLLKFMSAASEESIQIDAKENNETLMLMTFTDAILKHKVVANKLARILILFMVQNVKAIFTVPKEIRDRVNSRIDDLKTGEISPVRDNTYCTQVTVVEYQKQSEVCTENALVQMMNTILDDTNLHLKDKKQHLRQFQKHHPDLYNKHFSGML
ncbi:DEP domain-containing protein 7-like [Mytilus californianus]|uniref:DEP domain-containing protein 7-like n=1 Tax=Mytilus californianus TaxID=6549 RepID=UPI0022470A8D|nr:DEP domain-containing protein 7-like [Mytilus californianus]